MKVTPDIVKNYRGLALRTLSAASFLDKDPELYCTTNQLHAAIGLVTEIQEIKTDASKQEEISDSSWFLNLAADSVDADFAAMVHEATINVRRNLLATSSLAADGQMDKLNRVAIHLLDCAKASIYYGRKEHKNFLPKGEKLSWRDTVLNDVKAAAEAVAYLCVIWKIDIYQTLEKNIAKLKLRYPEKFDTDKASNRDVSKELGVFNANQRPIIGESVEKSAKEISEKFAGMNANLDRAVSLLPNLKMIGATDALTKEVLDKVEKLRGQTENLIMVDEYMHFEKTEVKSGLVEIQHDKIEAREDIVEVSDEAAAILNKDLVDESVVIEEIPAAELPVEIQEKIEEVGAKLGEFAAANPHIGQDFDEYLEEQGNRDEVIAAAEEKIAKGAEFSAEALVEAVEETAEQVKADKKKPGRKKNN